MENFLLFRTVYDLILLFIHKQTVREGRETLAQRICNFYIDSSNKSRRTPVNYSIKQGIARTTIYNILNKYLKYGQTKFLPRDGHPMKLLQDLFDKSI